MIIGMPFLDDLYPHTITKTHWWFTTLCKQRIAAKRVQNKVRKTTPWIKGSEKILQKLENESRKEELVEIIKFKINTLDNIQKKLELLYSEDPLRGWEK